MFCCIFDACFSLLSIVGFSCNMRASISHCAVVALPFVDVSSGEIVFPDKNDIVEALGMLQQCTKIHVQALGGCAGVLYDTIMAYVTCLHERRPILTEGAVAELREDAQGIKRGPG
jgi:hypothetical protein